MKHADLESQRRINDEIRRKFPAMLELNHRFTYGENIGRCVLERYDKSLLGDSGAIQIPLYRLGGVLLAGMEGLIWGSRKAYHKRGTTEYKEVTLSEENARILTLWSFDIIYGILPTVDFHIGLAEQRAELGEDVSELIAFEKGRDGWRRLMGETIEPEYDRVATKMYLQVASQGFLGDCYPGENPAEGLMRLRLMFPRHRKLVYNAGLGAGGRGHQWLAEAADVILRRGIEDSKHINKAPKYVWVAWSEHVVNWERTYKRFGNEEEAKEFVRVRRKSSPEHWHRWEIIPEYAAETPWIG